VRTAIGPVNISELQVGKWRALTGAEMRSLTHAGGN
jgi:16S rRNA U516 pseudouridylate synthase RsuA-like enzyme